MVERGKKHGFGEYVWGNAQLKYKGYFQEGSMDGEGLLEDTLSK